MLCSLRTLARAQVDEYYDSELDFIQREYELEGDYSLFLTPLEGGEDIFTSMSRYNFAHQRYLRRGYDYKYTQNLINNIDLNNPFDPYPYFSLSTLVRNMRTKETFNNGLLSTLESIGGLSGTQNYSTRAFDATAGSRATVSYSSARTPFSSSILTSNLSTNNKWAYIIYAKAQLGRDAQIDGLFGENYNFGFSLDHKISQDHSLSLFAGVTTNYYGERSPTTLEVYELADNNLYNSSWGYYNGKIRNAKVSSQTQPSIILTYDGTLTPSTKITASLSGIMTESGYNSLGWEDAQNPYPDYYQYLPSFLDEGDTKELVTQQWISSNTDLTQIDWAQIMQSNLNNGEEALYYIQNYRELTKDAQFRVSLITQTPYHISFNYGFELRHSSEQKSKVMEDLLGGSFTLNSDNILQENALVSLDEIFDYNYKLQATQTKAFATAYYNHRAWQMNLGLRIGSESYSREEILAKDEFAQLGMASQSSKLTFTPYLVKLSVGYSPSPKHNLQLNFSTGTEAPYLSNILKSADYINEFIENASMSASNSIELNYLIKLPKVQFKLSLFGTQFTNQTTSYSYYDDIYSQYCNMILEDVDTRHIGAELGINITLAKNWSISSALSIGEYIYNNNPNAKIYSNSDGSLCENSSTVFLDGYFVGNAPQRVASVQLEYSNGGWLANLGVNHSSRSYVDLNPLRRTLKVIGAAYYPELAEQLSTQEKLPSATTLNLFVCKFFNLGKAEFYATLLVKNLLNSSIIYSGYEQMRLSQEGSGIDTYYLPFDNKYLYSYNRSYSFSLTYKF